MFVVRDHMLKHTCWNIVFHMCPFCSINKLITLHIIFHNAFNTKGTVVKKATNQSSIETLILISSFIILHQLDVSCSWCTLVSFTCMPKLLINVLGIFTLRYKYSFCHLSHMESKKISVFIYQTHFKLKLHLLHKSYAILFEIPVSTISST